MNTVAWIVSDDDTPEISHWISEDTSNLDGYNCKPLIVLTPELEELVEAARDWGMINAGLELFYWSDTRLFAAIKAFEESAKEKV